VQENFLVRFMNILILVFIVIITIVFVTLPSLVDEYVKFSGIQVANIFWLKAFLYLTAIPFVVMLLKAKKLCKNILRAEPFCQSNIAALQLISLSAFIDFLLYAMGTITIFKNLLSLILMVAAFMVGLVSLILSQLVEVALEIKQENDLAI
jgi:hypothetical protein